jgi:hypothetical protein
MLKATGSWQLAIGFGPWSLEVALTETRGSARSCGKSEDKKPRTAINRDFNYQVTNLPNYQILVMSRYPDAPMDQALLKFSSGSSRAP